MVLLDKLLANVNVQVEPFAMCMVGSGWRLRLPGPPDAMFHFVLRGSGVLRDSQGQSHSLQRYWLALVPEGVPHMLECGEDVLAEQSIGAAPEGAGVAQLLAGSSESDGLQVACGIVNVTYGDSLRLFQRLGGIIVADLSAYPQVALAFESILAEQVSASQGSVALTQALMGQCLVYMLCSLTEQSDGGLAWLSGLEDPNLGRAVDLIFERPAAAHTVDSLADAAIMSRSVFAERFHRAFGCTPIRFLHDVRLRRAADLLRQSRDLSINQVADRVGFRSRSHFSQAFKDHFGATPAAFREGRELG